MKTHEFCFFDNPDDEAVGLRGKVYKLYCSKARLSSPKCPRRSRICHQLPEVDPRQHKVQGHVSDTLYYTLYLF